MKVFHIVCMVLMIAMMQHTCLADEQTEIIYGDGWTHYNYSDGSHSHKLAPINYLRWDGEWRPKIEMNFSSGDWPYLVEDLGTYYLITRLDDSLTLSKIYRTYDFQPYKIGVQLTLTPGQLNGMSTPVGDYWYITIPQSLKQTAKHLKWDNKLPTISNKTGFILNQSDNVSGEWLPNYKYQNVGGELRLYYGQIARDFGIASTEITFNFNSYVINGSTGWINTSRDGTIQEYTNNYIILQNDTFQIFASFNLDGEGSGTPPSSRTPVQNLSSVGGSLIRIQLLGHSVSASTFVNLSVAETDPNDDRNVVDDTWKLLSFDNGNSSKSTTGTVWTDWAMFNSYHNISVSHYESSGYFTYAFGLNQKYFKYSDISLIKDWSGESPTGDSNPIYLQEIQIANFVNVGNVTHQHDAGSGYHTISFIVNMTTPADTNYTVWYADNGSSFTQIGGVYTGNQTPSISGTKYQNTDLRIVMNGNSFATPEEMEVTFVTEALAAGAAPTTHVSLAQYDELDLPLILYILMISMLYLLIAFGQGVATIELSLIYLIFAFFFLLFQTVTLSVNYIYLTLFLLLFMISIAGITLEKGVD